MITTPGVVHISEMTSLALHGLAFMALGDSEVMNVRDIATSTGSSEAHLSKVLQRLAKAGLVKSGRGPKGGFALAKPPREVTLLDIFSAVEGAGAPGECPLDRPLCPFGKCLFGGVLGELESRFENYLSEMTLEQFARSVTAPKSIDFSHTVD